MKAKFDIKRDLRIIRKGGFMCNGCLVAKPLSKQSPKDARYCVDCQPIIEYEYSILADKGAWKRYKPVAPEAILSTIESPPEEVPAPLKKTKMSTSNENLAIVDNFRPRGRPKTYKKRELPEELIKQLCYEGIGSKAITSKLRDQGIEVSYKTIQRILSGQR